MLYREAGQFKTTYARDQAIFTIRQDYWFVIALLVFAFVVPPLTGSQYLMGPILTQFLVFGLAALGLKSAHRLRWPDLARHRRIHGGGGLHLL